MKTTQTLAVLLAVGTFLAGIGMAAAGPITFSEVTNGLSGTMIFADASLDGALVNAGTGDQTGINPGNSGGNNWGRVDTSFNANNATPAGNKAGLHSNVLEGISTAAPDLKWTVSTGSGDDASNGAGSLSPNTNYNVHVHYLTHTSGTQNWGGEMSNIATFATFDQFDNNNGTLITTVGTSNVDYRRFQLTTPVTTDGSGNAELYIRRPTSGTHLRTNIDGAVFQEQGSVPLTAQFDLNNAGDLNDNQTGYASLNAGLITDSATQNGITLTFTGNANGLGRDRGTGGNVAGSPVPDVTRDFTFNDDGRGFATPYFTVNLSGLLPDTDYDLRWHHFENSGTGGENRLALYKDSAIAANLLFETASYASNTTNYFTDFSATSDALGG